jgi:hypothetical protein
MSLVSFPARRPVVADVELTRRAQAAVQRVQRWRGRSIELLAALDADPRLMAQIRGMADQLIADIVRDDG